MMKVRSHQSFVCLANHGADLEELQNVDARVPLELLDLSFHHVETVDHIRRKISTVGSGAQRGTKPWRGNGNELMRIRQWDHGLDRTHLQVSQRQHRRTLTDNGNAIFDFGRRPYR